MSSSIRKGAIRLTDTTASPVHLRMWRLAVVVVVVCALYFLQEIILPVAVGRSSPLCFLPRRRDWKNSSGVLSRCWSRPRSLSA